MSTGATSFAFLVSLAAVINGLGIVRWLTGAAEYLRQRQVLQVNHYWVYTLTAAFQFLLHILLWWSLWGLRSSVDLNFLTYLYVLTGPILLYLSTALLIPDSSSDSFEFRAHFFNARPTYATTLILLFAWTIFSGPVVYGFFPANTILKGTFMALAIGLRATTSGRSHAIIAILNWVTLIAFITLYSLQLGEISP